MNLEILQQAIKEYEESKNPSSIKINDIVSYFNEKYLDENGISVEYVSDETFSFCRLRIKFYEELTKFTYFSSEKNMLIAFLYFMMYYNSLSVQELSEELLKIDNFFELVEEDLGGLNLLETSESLVLLLLHNIIQDVISYVGI